MTRSFAFLPYVLAGALAAQSFEDEFRRGLLALSGNDLAQARQSLENASRAQPDNAMVWAALAQTYLRVRETALANDAAGRAARLAPADSPVQHGPHIPVPAQPPLVQSGVPQTWQWPLPTNDFGPVCRFSRGCCLIFCFFGRSFVFMPGHPR